MKVFVPRKKGIIAIVLDESTSMKGQRWNSVTLGVKKFISSLEGKNVSKKSDLHILFFATSPRVVWSGKLSEEVPKSAWKLSGGFTFYGKVLK